MEADSTGMTPLAIGELKKKVLAQEKHIRWIKDQLRKIRDDPSTWKAGRISGCDQYQGLPSFLRIIDEILKG